MTSTRTEYRRKRIELLSEMIEHLFIILKTYDGKTLEKRVNLPRLKKLHQEVLNLENGSKDFLTEDKKEQVIQPIREGLPKRKNSPEVKI